jgi:hypothetical protein
MVLSLAMYMPSTITIFKLHLVQDQEVDKQITHWNFGEASTFAT